MIRSVMEPQRQPGSVRQTEASILDASLKGMANERLAQTAGFGHGHGW
jgi:hypothetical protein